MNRQNSPLSPERFPFMMMMTRLPFARAEWGEPHLLSQDEVAHRLGVSRTTLWRLIKADQLETVAIGSRTYVVRASIDDFIARNSSRRASS
ncbi:helix-turn-helix domain-containing protein [Microbacterium sp. P07]|uniref:helix-turn-helix domain-containing protein n=1 Tax=Microbacterium sp. P07 TaxID=3366952 RepID=UPI0037474BEA